MAEIGVQSNNFVSQGVVCSAVVNAATSAGDTITFEHNEAVAGVIFASTATSTQKTSATCKVVEEVSSGFARRIVQISVTDIGVHTAAGDEIFISSTTNTEFMPTGYYTVYEVVDDDNIKVDFQGKEEVSAADIAAGTTIATVNVCHDFTYAGNTLPTSAVLTQTENNTKTMITAGATAIPAGQRISLYIPLK